MTYNFDPDRWYDNELAVLKEDRRTGKLSAQEYDAAVDDLDRRYDEMMDRLDGSYLIPKGATIMYRVSIMYPNQEGAEFDFEYYRTTHMQLIEKHLKSFGLVKTEVDKGISGGGDEPAPYICTGHLYFKTRDGYDSGIAEVGSVLRGDIPHFTTIVPVRQVSEILD
jgi:uncharacterized protein (TIGR02118 family)